MNNYGILCILPLIILTIITISTKKIRLGLLVSICLTFILKEKIGFIKGIIYALYEIFNEGTFLWIMMMLVLFGAFVNLIISSGGTEGLKKIALKYIKSRKDSMIFTWCLGILLCVDDYINDLAIGPTVRNITDKYNIPREEVGFVICSMGVPVCSLLPITAFSVFVYGIMKDVGIVDLNSKPVLEYLKVIPYLFYPMMIIIVVFLFVTKISARNNDNLSLTTEYSYKETELYGDLIDCICPIFILVVTMLWTGKLPLSVIIGIIICFILYIPRKKIIIDEIIPIMITGILNMAEVLIIILLTFVLINGLNGIGLSDFVISVCEPYLIGEIIPVLVFVLVSLLVFFGVDYWAVMLLIAPLAIPIANQFSINLYLTMAAIVSGSICGATNCFFGEQVVMCSQSVEANPISVVTFGLPYNGIAFLTSAILYGVAGFIS